MSNKTALVVGGSRGIGKAIALRLADSGFDIVLTYKSNTKAAEETKKEIEEKDSKCVLLSFDIASNKEVQEKLGEKMKTYSFDVIVYNASIVKDNLMVFMNKEEWDTVLRTNLDGFYNIVNTVLFNMIANKQGRIIVISSISGERGQVGQANYSASKAGLIGAAKSLAREVGKKNIFVNVVSPGVIETEMSDDIPKKKILPMIPTGRIGAPEDVASLVDFLAKEENMYIHGEVIGVNGGLSI